MSQDHKIHISDEFGMPSLGIHLTEVYQSGIDFDVELKEALKHGYRHFELCNFGQLPHHCIYHIIKFATVKNLGKHHFFISTSIPVPVEGNTEFIRELLHLKDFLGYPLDLVYLENPVGIKGSDPLNQYETDDNGRIANYSDVRDLFVRHDEGQHYLKLTPSYLTQDLRAVWAYMEKAILMDGLAKNLGLKHFNVKQIESILKGCKLRPEVVMVEINAYNPAGDVIELCKDYKIPVVAALPFGNPNHIPVKSMPILLDHPTVKRLKTKVNVPGEVLLVRALLQNGVRVVFTNKEIKRPSFLLQNIFRFTLTKGQMNQLGRLQRLAFSIPPNEFETRCFLDPMWPFLIYDDSKDKEKGSEKRVMNIEASRISESSESPCKSTSPEAE